jgi:hypothetical protein
MQVMSCLLNGAQVPVRRGSQLPMLAGDDASESLSALAAGCVYKVSDVPPAGLTTIVGFQVRVPQRQLTR